MYNYKSQEATYRTVNRIEKLESTLPMLNSIYREMESVVRKNQECIEFLQFIIKPSVNVKEIQSSMVFDKMAFAAIGYAVESIKGAIDMLKTIIDES